MDDASFSRHGCVEVPHHITSIWVPYIRADYLRSGSRGLGLIVSPRLKACWFKRRIVPPYQPIDELDFVENRISTDSLIGIKTTLPPGYGYAVSAATFISYYLLSGFLAGSRSYLGSLDEAHMAEIGVKTGLGDVLAISYGKGVAFRVKEGSPSKGTVENFKTPQSIEVISIYKERMHTNKLLSMYNSKTRRLAIKLLKKFDMNPGFECFLEVSEEFTFKAGMHSFPRNELCFLRKIPGVIGVYAKKSVSVLFIEKDKLLDAVYQLREASSSTRILRLEPDYNGIIFIGI
ncbi:MAG: hypothetical protein F7B59_05255 [Desulfurococcales archaeon]|nr:hypothetical protein [Desulfurococcales archaeon]